MIYVDPATQQEYEIADGSTPAQAAQQVRRQQYARNANGPMGAVGAIAQQLGGIFAQDPYGQSIAPEPPRIPIPVESTLVGVTPDVANKRIAMEMQARQADAARVQNDREMMMRQRMQQQQMFQKAVENEKQRAAVLNLEKTRLKNAMDERKLMEESARFKLEQETEQERIKADAKINAPYTLSENARRFMPGENGQDVMVAEGVREFPMPKFYTPFEALSPDDGKIHQYMYRPEVDEQGRAIPSENGEISYVQQDLGIMPEKQSSGKEVTIAGRSYVPKYAGTEFYDRETGKAFGGNDVSGFVREQISRREKLSDKLSLSLSKGEITIEDFNQTLDQIAPLPDLSPEEWRSLPDDLKRLIPEPLAKENWGHLLPPNTAPAQAAPVVGSKGPNGGRVEYLNGIAYEVMD